MRTVCRTLTLALCTAFVAAGTFTFADADARSIQYDLNIPSEDLTAALQSFAIASHHKLLYKAELTAGKTSRALKGHFTAQEAVEALLSGTGLTFQITGSSVVLIRDENAGNTSELHKNGATSPADDDPNVTASQSKEGKSSSSGGFRVAQVDQGKSSSAPLVGNQASSVQENSKSPSGGLEEIVVTAQKRAERLQEVPVPVTVLSADKLVDNNQLRIQDYYTSVPGLTLSQVSGEGSLQSIAIRGISSVGGGSPTVGVLVDDVSYGTSKDGVLVPDIDPGDLARVEVLRGPQGTLYGASSMGGLIKYVTVDPSTNGFSGRAEAGMSGVHNGAELGYNFRGSVNVPLNDTVALRASGFTRQDPGYIDNPILGIRGINEVHVSGGHLSLLWRPSDALSLKLSALYQDTKADGNSGVEVEPGLGDLQQNYPRGVGSYDVTVQAYSATVNAKLGLFDLTSLTGYNSSRNNLSWDYTYQLGAASNAFFSVGGAPVEDEFKNTKFTQEVRLSAPIGPNIEWLIGGFYTHESHPNSLNVLAEDLATGAIAGQVLELDTWMSTYDEYAGFTNLTYHFTDQFDIQVGGRESHISQSSQETLLGAAVLPFYGSPSPLVNPRQDSTSNAFTYLVTPRFKVTSDLMVYARLASGFRAGGANVSIPGEPPQFNPDKTENYEVGLKGDFWDHKLSIDASIYYIDWSQIQVAAFDPKTTERFTANAGEAKSDGVEFSAELKPLTGLTIGGWVTYQDAVLTKSFPSNSTVYGVPGNRLPFSTRFSGNLSLQQDFRLSNNVEAFAGGLVTYVGDSLGTFASTNQRQSYPAYTTADLRTGLKYESWTANLFVSNIADKRVIVSGGLGWTPPFAFSYLQPRTVGLSLARTF